MTDEELAERLHKLVMADIVAPGSSELHDQGLGDRIFAMVFRRLLGAQDKDGADLMIEVKDREKGALGTS